MHIGLSDEIIKVIEELIGGYGIVFAVAFVTYIGGEKKARIVRQTPTKTVFHLLETDRKLIVPNVDLYKLRVEKVLPGANNGRDL